MPSEIETFQQDLLESVRQMRLGQAARTTEVSLTPAAFPFSQPGAIIDS